MNGQFTSKDYFPFNRRERNVILTLVSAIVLFTIVPYIYKKYIAESRTESWEEFINEKSKDDQLSDGENLQKSDNESQRESKKSPPPLTKKEIEKNGSNASRSSSLSTPLDINKATHSDLIKIDGISPSLAGRIIKYRDAKGGYRDIKELQKVYGLDDQSYHLLKRNTFITKVPRKEAFKGVLDLNTVVPDDLAQLKGIGPVLSDRIVKYRDAKGGFKSLEELKDVYGLAPEAYTDILPYLTLSIPESADSEAIIDSTYAHTEIKPVFDLNSVSKEELKSIKGIGAVISKGIVEKRERLGGYHSMDQLLSVYAFTSELLVEVGDQLTIGSGYNRFDINDISFKDLLRMGILDYEEVKYIFQLKKAKKGIKSEADLRLLQGIPDDKIDELLPYLLFDDTDASDN